MYHGSRDRRSERRGGSWAAIVMVVGCIAPLAGPAQADEEMERVLAEAGKAHYDHYCSPCHGAGGAPGKVDADLRTYVERNGGKFPTGRWLELLADVEPGNVHASVWKRIREDQSSVSVGGDATARAIIGQIARYIASVQSK